MLIIFVVCCQNHIVKFWYNKYLHWIIFFIKTKNDNKLFLFKLGGHTKFNHYLSKIVTRIVVDEIFRFSMKFIVNKSLM